MILEDVWTLLERTTFNVPSTNTYFNQYNDNRPELVSAVSIPVPLLFVGLRPEN